MKIYKNWTTQEENLLRELLSQKKYSFNQMAKFFDGRTGTALRKHALKYMKLTNEDFINKKYSYNQNFFEIPNVINSYVAGFYAADGVVSETSTKYLSLILSDKELDQLNKFKNLFEYTGTVNPRNYSGKENMYGLLLCSADKLTTDLEKNFNVDQNKTYRLPPPNLNDPQLILAYIIGILDGDGCVHMNTQDKLTITYTSSSLKIVEWIKEEIEKMNLKTIRERFAKISKCSHANAYNYQVSGAKAISLIKKARELKKLGVPILDRKWDNEALNKYIEEFERKFDTKF